MPEAARDMTPRSESEAKVRDLLSEIGLLLVAENHLLHRENGDEDAEIDLVFRLGNATFVVEVTTSNQEETRRKKRKELREWPERDVVRRITRDLRLPQGNRTRIVYVSLATTREGPPVIDGNIALFHSNHIEELSDCAYDDPAHALEMFVEFCGMWGIVDPDA